jgi:hypothetical protein
MRRIWLECFISDDHDLFIVLHSTPLASLGMLDKKNRISACKLDSAASQ